MNSPRVSIAQSGFVEKAGRRWTGPFWSLLIHIMAAEVLDSPERFLSSGPIGTADVPDGEPACQLRALISANQPTSLTTRKQTALIKLNERLLGVGSGHSVVANYDGGAKARADRRSGKKPIISTTKGMNSPL